MSGLVIFTGANGSLGLYSAEHILKKYPTYTAIFTVRDASSLDANTQSLQDIIAKYPEANASILPLDLASLAATHTFADAIIQGINSGKYPPIAAIVGNAYYWNLVGNPELSEDGYDKTFQVSFLSHAALVLRLLGSFGPNGGRVVLISSDSHWPGKNAMEKYPPAIPEDINLLVKPNMDDDKQGRGYQRYAISKLAITAWVHALNRRLEKVITTYYISFCLLDVLSNHWRRMRTLSG
jgi:NAD(P)-dependent dehydrogenase (short-subunit alcohol dehydrogenase family)